MRARRGNCFNQEVEVWKRKNRKTLRCCCGGYNKHLKEGREQCVKILCCLKFTPSHSRMLEYKKWLGEKTTRKLCNKHKRRSQPCKYIKKEGAKRKPAPCVGLASGSWFWTGRSLVRMILLAIDKRYLRPLGHFHNIFAVLDSFQSRLAVEVAMSVVKILLFYIFPVRHTVQINDKPEQF